MGIRKNNVLILGCGRSGTSIFGEFFKFLEGFEYYSEIDFGEIMELKNVMKIAMKVPRTNVSFPPDQGLSFPLKDMYEKFNSDLQIFWIVRHPLDTICSLKVGISKNWGHHPRPPEWEGYTHKSLLEKCAIHWNYINGVGYNTVKNQVDVVQFESMIKDPKLFSKHVMAKVNINEVENRKVLDEWIERVQNTNNEKFIEAETSIPYSTNDHLRRIGRWKENMNKKEVELLWPIVQSIAQSFNYEI